MELLSSKDFPLSLPPSPSIFHLCFCLSPPCPARLDTLPTSSSSASPLLLLAHLLLLLHLFQSSSPIWQKTIPPKRRPLERRTRVPPLVDAVPDNQRRCRRRGLPLLLPLPLLEVVRRLGAHAQDP